MRRRVPRSLYAGVLASLFLLRAAPARAQFQPRLEDEIPPAEKYIVEGAMGFWLPNADISVSSGGSGVLQGIVGTTINAKTDLGLVDQRFPEFHFEIRPARRHKIRFQSIPIEYDQTSTLRRDIVFNGQKYQVGIPTASTLDWRAYRFGYEFDFISRSRVSSGFILDFKYTDVSVNLKSPVLTEFARARAPIPAVGGMARVYVVPSVSVTGELTGFSLPESVIKNAGGHYFDLNIYGTANINRYVGFQAGYRRFDVNYLVKADTGSFVLKGLFFGFVARY